MLSAIYIAIAKDWMRVYGRDGVYILTLEDWYENTGKEFEKLLKFLELRKYTHFVFVLFVLVCLLKGV